MHLTIICDLLVRLLSAISSWMFEPTGLKFLGVGGDLPRMVLGGVW